ncbi:M48 family metallopeptidase [Geomonas sp. Red32]|uniref:M48 family metallopeptidase n=1 Tax=Geomonas sp. Red32 TaxID=2912856 RepID=UPI00202CBDC4|nr:M48 family metallopeptidase [Geomonas sp. Red32]MCM0081283.1 M48 family metallopeptidase [Geomonas sp. Red32]
MKEILIALFLVRFAAVTLLRFVNVRHLQQHGAEVPEAFAGAVDAATLAKSADYTVAQSRVSLLHSIYDGVLLLGFLFTPLFPRFDAWINTLSGSFYVRSLLFMLILTLVETVLDLPFSYYSTFDLEKRYGFNTTTMKLWLSDLAKSALISVILLLVVGWSALALVTHSPEHWWLWVWAFFAIFSITLMYLSPYLIEPLFSKFEPVSDQELEEEIRLLLDKCGLKIKAVQQVDASRRSLHSNAYFTGIGKVKRIVLYDTLLKQMDRSEVLAILAHEAGHWKKGHILKMLVGTELVALAVCYVVFRLIGWGAVPAMFGINGVSFAGQLVLISFILSLVSFLFTPLRSWLSRRNEWQADRFATELTGAPQALARALVKLSRENLANLHPHPLYAAFYYSHPPVVERVAKLNAPEVAKK